jgi:hypothetical protein
MQASKTDAQRRDAKQPADLQERYGNIGISALVAALRYQAETKNPAYARDERTAKHTVKAI